MIFTTNFSRSSDKWLAFINNFMLIAIVFFLLLFLYLFNKGSIIQDQIVELTDNKLKLQEHIKEQRLIIQRYLTDGQLSQLKADVLKINAVSDLKSLDLATVLSVFEYILPKNIFIDELRYNAQNSASNLVIKSSNDDALNNFVEKIQQDPRFERVELIDQKQQNENNSVIYIYQLIIHHKQKA